MSTGVYGTRGLSVINIATDVDIYYNYRPTRNAIDNNFGFDYLKYPNPSEIIQNVNIGNLNVAGIGTTLNGVYNLNLPLSTFSQKGIYSILITPKEAYGYITDSPAVLTAFPSIRGVVIQHSNFSDITSLENQSLVGWKISYYDELGNKTDNFKIITSNGFVEPVASNLSNTSQKSISYRYNDNSNLVFLTVTPSSAPVVKPNALPSIGAVNQRISISNTKFNPIFMEIEMTDTDTSTITDLLASDQALNLDNGTLTTYNENRDIINQVEIIQKKDSYGRPLYEIRKNKKNLINRNENYENAFSGV